MQFREPADTELDFHSTTSEPSSGPGTGDPSRAARLGWWMRLCEKLQDAPGLSGGDSRWLLPERNYGV